MTTVYVSFSAEINQTTTENLLGFCAQKVNEGAKTLYLALSTPGGQVANGITIYNVLKGLPVHLITHNVGMVNSIGNVIFLAGEERYACPSSSFMFHGVGFDIERSRFEEKHLVEKLDGIRNDQKLIGQIISSRTNIDTDETESLFLQAASKDPAFAKEKGIIDDIRDFTVPDGFHLQQLVFQR